MVNLILNLIKNLIFLVLLLCFLFSSFQVKASEIINPSGIGLQNRISNNFTSKYCKAIDSGLSKDEAMRSAIIDTENIVSFSLNPQKKKIVKEELANQIAIKVINKCGWSFGLVGKEGISYFKNYFLEINEKTTPNKKLSGWNFAMNNLSDKNVFLILIITVLFVFGLIFSVKSPERKVIDSPIMWKDEYINSSIKTFDIIENSSIIFKI